MKPTDTSEKGLEALIVKHLAGISEHPAVSAAASQECVAVYAPGGYVLGRASDYNRDVALDVRVLLAFLQDTQPAVVETLELASEGIKRTQFLHRIQGEVAKRGVVDVLRKGVSHGPAHVDLYKLLPTPGNASAAANFGKNIFSVTRQVRYSNDESQRALDMVIFINGLPVLTFELKNSLTKQTVADAIIQYQNDRNPNELLFQLGRCVAHLAVDDAEVRFCTHLTGKSSWFLPFNQGWNSGAGKVNALIESRRMLTNASYFAFTATPKNKTLELFGERYVEGNEVSFRSPEELTYTTKQAIQEGFILDVIANYTPVDSFYHVAKTVEDDPDFDKVKALKKIRHYVESHDKAIRKKAEIMVDHFVAQVAGKQKVRSRSRAKPRPLYAAWIPGCDSDLRSSCLGKTVHFLEFPDPETPRAKGGRPLQGGIGSHRYG